MNLIIMSLILALGISVLLNCKLVDVLHRIDARVDEDGELWGWSKEELEAEILQLRQANDELRRQNDFLIGRM